MPEQEETPGPKAGRDETATVSLKVRAKEPLRAMLEESARQRGVSMNAEIVRRLERSFERHDHVINGVAIGGELYKALRDLIALNDRLNKVVLSFGAGSIDHSSLQNEVIGLTAILISLQNRLLSVLETLIPAGMGLSITQQGEDVSIVGRTLKEDDQ